MIDRMRNLRPSWVRPSTKSPSLVQDYITETGDMYVDVFDRNVCINFPYF
ncbi:hypothetical protein [Novosphingobium sp. 9U]|nr:hypothetical protein [Novosphingobium sp. 9U]